MTCNVLLTHARSGSTELFRALLAATGVGKHRHEPFARPMQEKGIEVGTDAYEAYLEEVMRNSELIKHIWKSIPLEDTVRLIKNRNTRNVLLLYRSSTFEAALSSAAARFGTREWRRPEKDLTRTLKPISLRLFEKEKSYLDQTIPFFKGVLAVGNVPYKIITYEALYAPASIDKKVEILRDLCAFLGFPADNSGLEKGAQMLMGGRYHQEGFYEKIPNFRQLKQRFAPLVDSQTLEQGVAAQ